MEFVPMNRIKTKPLELSLVADPKYVGEAPWDMPFSKKYGDQMGMGEFLKPYDKKLEWPTLFTSEEVDEKIPVSDIDWDHKRLHKDLSDPAQLIESLAKVGTKFPHIYKRVIAIWGSRELDEWLKDIVMETHRPNGDPRQGFPPDIMAELLKLYNIHARCINKQIPHQHWKV